MKVGVITFHSANNYGAVLQTWALQKVLRNYNIEAGVIHYHPDIIDRLYDPFKGRQGLAREINKIKQSIVNKDSVIRYNKYINFLKENFNLIGDYKTYDQLKSAKMNLDAYIVGSDQVWNDSHTGGYDPAYLLEFAKEGKKRISYAASIGRDYFNPKYLDDYKRGLQGLDFISIRERSLIKAVEELVDTPVEVVLDPTMLIEKKDYDEIKKSATIKERYILVYMIEGNQMMVRFANRISRSLGIPLIQRRPAAKLDNELEPFYTADTGEFLGLMENAEYVITNSFHGTVFSIIYNRPFISMLHSDTGSRTADLLHDLGMESHLLYDVKDFDGLDNFNIEDSEKLKNKIKQLRESS